MLKLLVLSFSTIIALVLAEAVVRMVPSGERHRVDSAYFRTINEPLNSLGYHDYEYPRKKGRGVYRIIVVGDSFSLGAAVNLGDSWPKRLESYLNIFGNEEGIKYQVMNLSWSRFSTPQELRVIKKRAPELNPDMVIIGYCLNDAENRETVKEVKKLLRKAPHNRFEEPHGWRYFVYDHSALGKLVFHRLFNTRQHREYKNYYNWLYQDDYSGWQKTQRALMELGELSRSNKIPTHVVIFPLFSFGLEHNYPFAAIHTKVHKALQKAGLTHTDLLSYYRHMDHISLECVPYEDPHPSEIAHRIAAEALWQELKKSGSLPGGKKTEKDIAYPRKPPF